MYNEPEVIFMQEAVYPSSMLELSNYYGNIFIEEYTTEYAEHHTESIGHRHDYYSIELVTGGEAVQYINEEKYVCREGSIVLMSPFDSHRYKYSGVLTLEFMCFDEGMLFSDVWDNIDIDNFPYVAELNDDEFVSALSDISTIRKEKKRRDEMSEIMIKSTTNKLVAMILRGAHKKCEKRKHKDIKSALSYIRYHFREPITMEEMADKLHITPSYFCRCFKDYTHQTFKEYITALRLEYAMRQIKTTDKSITEICYESGFSTCAYFSKIFTKKFGKTPKEIRKSKIDFEHLRE